MAKVNVKALTELSEKLFENAGVPADEAKLIVETLIDADRRGVKSHGVATIPRYVGLINQGLMKPAADYEVIRSMGVTEVWDGKRSNGQVLSVKAMERAIELAKTGGIGAVAIRRGNHFGAGAYYSEMAKKAGMIGIAMSTGSPTMAPWGGCEKKIGNNPLALAVPTGGETPILLDMAQSVVAAGKVTNLIKMGETEAPEGWILDKNGQPTTKLSEYYSVTPLGGYKGFSMSLMIDILSGVLFGGETGDRADDRVEGPSFLMVAINIGAFREPDEFIADMDARITELKDVTPAAGGNGVKMPGEQSDQRRAAQVEMVEVIDEILADINAMAEAAGFETV